MTHRRSVIVPRLSVVVLLGLVPTHALASDYSLTFAWANSSLAAGWEPANVIDGSPFTNWSSANQGSANGYDFIEVHMASAQTVDHVHLRPRMYNGTPTCVPEYVYVYYRDSGDTSWLFDQQYNLPARISPEGVIIPLTQPRSTRKILMTTTRFRNDGFGGYYFQLSGVSVGNNVITDKIGVDLQSWFRDASQYWRTRSTDTAYLYNPDVQVGVNKSFGGVIFEMYGASPWDNLIMESGGGAIQGSYYGAGPVNPSTGHPPQYTPGHTCNGWADDAPFNPIQAAGPNCVYSIGGGASNMTQNDIFPAIETNTIVHFDKFGDAYQFSKDMAFPMEWSQAVRQDDQNGGPQPYVRINYRARSSSTLNLTDSGPQELPALFTSPGISAKYTFVTASGLTTRTFTTRVQQYAVLPGKTALHDPAMYSSVAVVENWVSACDTTDTRCVTVATWGAEPHEIAMGIPVNDGTGQPLPLDPSVTGGFVGPVGTFPLNSSGDHFFTVYVFPYRYDTVVAGKTVRTWISQLKARDNP